jgi:hypothetical protein
MDEVLPRWADLFRFRRRNLHFRFRRTNVRFRFRFRLAPPTLTPAASEPRRSQTDFAYKQFLTRKFKVLTLLNQLFSAEKTYEKL